MNSSWTSYGNVVAFTPTQYYQITDIEGNEYKAVTIGTQIWMKENLKTTKYNDGTPIPNVRDNATWAGLTTAAYCWYDNDSATYWANNGALYNWNVVNRAINGNKNICPTGWHVPSQEQWTVLVDYLINNKYGSGGSGSYIGKSMASTSGWNVYDAAPGSASDDQGSNNGSGFTGFPAGARSGINWQNENNGAFYSVGYGGLWWSVCATENGGVFILANRQLVNNGGDVINATSQYSSFGYSIRCLKDN